MDLPQSFSTFSVHTLSRTTPKVPAVHSDHRDSPFSFWPSHVCVCSSSACNTCTALASIRFIPRKFVLLKFGLRRLGWSVPPACCGSLLCLPHDFFFFFFFFFRCRSFPRFHFAACRCTPRAGTRMHLADTVSRRVAWEASSSLQTFAA